MSLYKHIPTQIILFFSCHKLQTVVPKAILNRIAMGFENLFSCKLTISSNNPIDSP